MEKQDRGQAAGMFLCACPALIAGARFYMNGNLIVTTDTARQLDQYISLLDHTLKEIRRIARQWMPETLVKGGLDMALKELCAHTEKVARRPLHYISHGLDGKAADMDMAFKVYQVVKEMLDECLHQSLEAEITVKVNRDQDRFRVNIASADRERTAYIAIPA